MQVVEHFGDYEIISMSNGEKKERWGKYYLLRPDPEIIWKEKIEYNDISAHYHRSNKGGGAWEFKKTLKDSWTVKYKELVFKISPTPFKHTGLFPEQAVNCDYMIEKIKKSKLCYGNDKKNFFDVFI